MRARQPLTLRQAQCHAADMGHKEGWPRSYYWISVWWRLSARESGNPQECLRYSKNQQQLYADIIRRPAHYKLQKAITNKTDWQIFESGKA